MKSCVVIFAIVVILSQGGNVDGGIFDTLGSGISKLTMTLTKPIDGASKLVGGLADTFTNLLTVGIASTSNVTVGVFNRTVNTTTSALNGFINIANNAVTTNIKAVTDVVKLIVESVVNGVGLVIDTIKMSAEAIQNIRKIITDSISNLTGALTEQVTDCGSKLNELGLSTAANILQAFLTNATSIIDNLGQNVTGQLNSLSTYMNTTATNLTTVATQYIGNVTKELIAQTGKTYNDSCLMEISDEIADESIIPKITVCINETAMTLTDLIPDISEVQNASESSINKVCNCVADITLGSIQSMGLETEECTDAASALLNNNIVQQPVSEIIKAITAQTGGIKSTYDNCLNDVSNEIKNLNSTIQMKINECEMARKLLID